MTTAAVAASNTIDPGWFRKVLGRLPTAVVVITAVGTDGRPHGMTVGSFGSLSLDPPLVTFFPSHTSTTWPHIRAAGSFCANVLGDRQEALCRRFAMSSDERFVGTSWHPGPSGAPVLDGAVVWIDGEIVDVHPAGDHDIVIARVRALDVETTDLPLVFLGGAYGRVALKSFSAYDVDVIKQLRVADLARDEMELLAAEIGRECLLTAPVADQLVLVAAAGSTPGDGLQTRVGQRVPYAPPMGAVFAAWADEIERAAWIGRMPHALLKLEPELQLRLERVRRRGFSVAVGREVHREVEQVLRASAASTDVVATQLSLGTLMSDIDPEELTQQAGREARSLAVPVLDAHGRAAYSLGAHRLDRRLSVADIDVLAKRLRRSADRIAAFVGGEGGSAQ